MPRFSTTVSVIASGTALAVLAHLFIDNYHQEISDAVEQVSQLALVQLPRTPNGDSGKLYDRRI